MGARRPDSASPGGGAPSDGYRLPPSSRIRTTSEIRSMFRRGKRRRTAHLDVFLAASPVSLPRLGLVVPKHGRTNVARNRLKRRIRELGRTRVLPALREAGRPLDVLVRARREAYDAAFDELAIELASVVEEACSEPRSWG